MSFIFRKFFLNTETQRHKVFFRERKIQRAAKAAFTKDTELSAAMQVPLGGFRGASAAKLSIRKALWRLSSRL